MTLFGNGGGSSVLGTDAFAAAGLDVSPFGGAARLPLEAMELPPGTSVANPIDTPVRTLQEKDGWVAGEILDIVYEHARPDAVAMHLNLAAFVGRGSVDPIDNLFTVVEQTQRKWPGVAAFRARACGPTARPNSTSAARLSGKGARGGVPVFDEIPAMAQALAGRRTSRASHGGAAGSAGPDRTDGTFIAEPGPLHEGLDLFRREAGERADRADTGPNASSISGPNRLKISAM